MPWRLAVWSALQGHAADARMPGGAGSGTPIPAVPTRPSVRIGTNWSHNLAALAHHHERRRTRPGARDLSAAWQGATGRIGVCAKTGSGVLKPETPDPVFAQVL